MDGASYSPTPFSTLPSLVTPDQLAQLKLDHPRHEAGRDHANIGRETDVRDRLLRLHATEGGINTVAGRIARRLVRLPRNEEVPRLFRFHGHVVELALVDEARRAVFSLQQWLVDLQVLPFARSHSIPS